MDDRELWDRIRGRDVNAFDALYRECGSRLQSFLKLLLGNHHAAEDVTQKTFASIWERPHGFDPERGTLRAYIFGAGRKRAAEWWRKQKPDAESATEAVEECRVETQSLIGNAFMKLPVEQRTVLWLREVEGRSYEELAKIFEIPEGTVRSRLFAARKALKQVWHAKPNGEEAS